MSNVRHSLRCCAQNQRQCIYQRENHKRYRPRARSSRGQTCRHWIGWTWIRWIMPSGVPFSRWATINEVSPQMTNWNEQSSNRCVTKTAAAVNRQERQSVNGVVVVSLVECTVRQNGGHIEHMFSWHVKCWLCVAVLLSACFVKFFVKLKNTNCCRRHFKILIISIGLHPTPSLEKFKINVVRWR